MKYIVIMQVRNRYNCDGDCKIKTIVKPCDENTTIEDIDKWISISNKNFLGDIIQLGDIKLVKVKEEDTKELQNMIKITKKDCIGQLKGYPVQIAQRMVECQVEQGNNPDITVFQKKIWTSRLDGGFDWESTKEGISFWNNVLDLKIFDIFFDKYPL